ncbi:MAG: class I SAM-dependent methyltransferase, partial [Lachnospiraceae bacterium]|nr:class I SAM-dependent methyltransferase [Lachnospiraceae bacterium]
MDKVVKIDKNSSQENLIPSLFNRVVARRNWPDLFEDALDEQMMELIDYDFSEYEAKRDSRASKHAGLYAGCMQTAILTEIRSYLKEHPLATVVSLAGGLDSTALVADNDTCRMLFLDDSKVVKIREALLPSSSRIKNRPINIRERLWYDKVEYDPEKGAIFILTNLFVYWKEEDVRRFINEMSKRFRG